MSWQDDCDSGERVDPRQEVERLRGLLDEAQADARLVREDLAAVTSRCVDLQHAVDKAEERVGVLEDAIDEALTTLVSVEIHCEGYRDLVEWIKGAATRARDEIERLRDFDEASVLETALRVLWDDARVSRRDLELVSRQIDPVRTLKLWRNA